MPSCFPKCCCSVFTPMGPKISDDGLRGQAVLLEAASGFLHQSCVLLISWVPPSGEGAGGWAEGARRLTPATPTD